MRAAGGGPCPRESTPTRYSIRRAAVFLGIGRNGLATQVAKGTIPATRRGGEWRIAGAVILARLEARGNAERSAETRRAAAAAAIDPALAYAVADAARALGVSRNTVGRWTKTGTLPAAKRGRVWQVRGADLLALLEADKGDRPG